MDNAFKVRVTAADRMIDSVIITFSDGRSGVYSSQLLYSVLDSARELHEADTVETEAAASPGAQ